MYIVEHIYDVDGGFGDAIETCEVVGVCASEEEAIAYSERWNKCRIYDTPYSNLTYGTIRYYKAKELNIEECPYEYYDDITADD